MSVAEGILRRRGETGWIVLAEALPVFGGVHRDLGDKVLSSIDLSLPPLCILAPEHELESTQDFLEEVEALLGLPIEVIQLEEFSGAEWSQAGLIVLVGGPSEAWVTRLSRLGRGSRPSYGPAEGSLVLAAGPAAGALGSWVLSPGESAPSPGLGWLPGAMVLPGWGAPTEKEPVRKALAREERSYAVALPESSILALGPEGEVEVWGDVKPTIALGPSWSRI